MISDDPLKGLSVVDLYEEIKKNCKVDNLNNKLKKIFFKTVGKTPFEELNEYKYDFDYAKKNLLYFRVRGLSKLENKDEFISNISYTIDLAQKNNVESLSKEKFTSNLFFPG